MLIHIEARTENDTFSIAHFKSFEQDIQFTFLLIKIDLLYSELLLFLLYFVRNANSQKKNALFTSSV